MGPVPLIERPGPRYKKSLECHTRKPKKKYWAVSCLRVSLLRPKVSHCGSWVLAGLYDGACIKGLVDGAYINRLK